MSFHLATCLAKVKIDQNALLINLFIVFYINACVIFAAGVRGPPGENGF